MTFTPPIVGNYKSPPGSNGNDGALPTSYIPGWNGYQNLTPAQRIAFESFPEDLVLWAAHRRWQAEQYSTLTANLVLMAGEQPTTVTLLANDRSKVLLVGLRQAIDDGLLTSSTFKDANGVWCAVDGAGAKSAHGVVTGFVNQLIATEGQIVSAINAKTITTRKGVDAAIAAVAPNSPSATAPWPT